MGNVTLTEERTADGGWGAESLDLDAYFARIGYDGPRTATTRTLAALHRAHHAAVCFENLDVALGREMPLDVESLQRKMVATRRGGYCFEQNLLFAAALERLGFPLTRHLARIRRGRRTVRYRSHAALVVEAEGRPYLCDVGYGDEGLIEPIPFEPGARLTVGDWTWGVGLDGDEWILQSLHPDGWFDVYALRLERHHPADFEVSHYYTAHHPASRFTGAVVAMRGDEHVRHTLKNRTLAARYADGRTLRTELAPDEVVHVLRGTFGLTVTGEEAIQLQRCVASYRD
ncbi:N-hydroxyarylamine O-acetyltransferase [Streptomyces olivoverticillatus]|uniref:N-hydroxyarylamine O-acetyltransferase n=1 Tax=Streptomyces olivoverticillatus TaxID=66427 RepID=A0A7W7PNH8_9ACTN|nr:arylamine N-acetyltransferase [Streptomyces olivoverticillatus]MBB4895533.1 N-hydroxyarylamine O-acetyltransferase [Streptomyces olivoverticillatus]